MKKGLAMLESTSATGMETVSHTAVGRINVLKIMRTARIRLIREVYMNSALQVNNVNRDAATRMAYTPVMISLIAKILRERYSCCQLDFSYL